MGLGAGGFTGRMILTRYGCKTATASKVRGAMINMSDKSALQGLQELLLQQATCAALRHLHRLQRLAADEAAQGEKKLKQGGRCNAKI